MTYREKFSVFFNNARCRKVGRMYVVTCYNYEVSHDRIIASEALTAEKAWSVAWLSFKRHILVGLSTEYSEPWLELPDGVMLPSKNDMRWTWQDFRDDPTVRHLWIDILKPSPRFGSMLDGIIQLLEQEVCD
jgi:hypothetical protein